jgi:FAD/FMN-containing dehydrogenase
VVAGDGRLLEFGGRVVKNVAGYDVVRLLVGSRGSLAVITAFHLRLRSLPERDLTLLLDAPDAAAAAALALAVRDAAAPAALEVVAPRASTTGWQVAARLHGSAAAVAAAVTAAARAAGAPGRDVVGLQATTWWDDRACEERSTPLRLRLTALPDRMGALLAAAEKFLKSWSHNESGRGLGWCQGHATEGIVRLGSTLPASVAGAPAEALGELAAAVVSVGGTWTYDNVPESWPGDLAERLPEPPARAPAVLRLERELKARFDPAGVLPEAFG